MKAKIMILCLLVLLSIAAVSASDADNRTVQTIDDAQDNTIGADELDGQDIVAHSDKNVLNASFSDLQTLISNTPLGGQVYLDKDYSLADGGSTLKISKSITIEGNGHTLDGANKSTIISIEKSADGGSITFKNIKFVNGKAAKNGGAILNTHSTTFLTLINCEFRDNNAGDCGGAIYSDGNVYINGSTFNSNHAKKDGGAIKSAGECYIDTGTFNNNFAEHDGGAIYADKKLTLFGKNRFENNQVRYNGGAIYASKDVYINWNGNANNALCEMYSNSYDRDNRLKNIYGMSGGAIYAKGNLFAKFLKCNYNQAARFGGAVYCGGETHIIRSEFYKNNAVFPAKSTHPRPTCGGAVYSEGACYIESCTFNGNVAKDVGGAIGAFHDLTIKDSNFNDNRVLIGQGGAVSCSGLTTVSNSVFNNNRLDKAPSYIVYGGGAIFSDKSITVDSCSFYNNGFNDDPKCEGNTWGGAVYTNNDAKITNSNFTHCWAKNGGAVYAGTIKNAVTNCIFNNCSATHGSGGAIYIRHESKSEFISCRFEADKCTDNGGAIYLYRITSHLKLSYCTFVDNAAGKKGQNVYNSGYYDGIDMCWFGTNNPNFKDQFKIYHAFKSDEDYKVTNYLKIAMKVTQGEHYDYDYYLGNPYDVTVYFYASNGQSLNKDLPHSSANFYGDGNFSNIKSDVVGDITAVVNFTKEYSTIYGNLDHETLSLSHSVKEKQSDAVRIYTCRDIVYPDDLLVNYHIDYQTNANYVIKDSKGEIAQQGEVPVNPNDQLFIRGLLPGYYSITISNPETWHTLPSNATAYFNVAKRYSVNVTADNVVYGNPTTITLKSDLDGLYHVQIGMIIFDVDVVNGSGVKQVMLNAGEYKTITKIVSTDFIYMSYNEAIFNVSKANPEFKLNSSGTEFVYGDVFSITPVLPSDATGNILYSLNKGIYAYFDVNESLILYDLDAGSYLIEASYSGDSNYNYADENMTISVYPVHSNVAVVVSDVTYGYDVLVEVSADVDGDYGVDINGTVYTVSVANGTGNISLSLNAGCYYANVTAVNKNFIIKSKNATFNVFKANPILLIFVFDEVYPQDVEGALYASADGDYNLTIDKYSAIITVKDNLAYFNVGTLDAGIYETTVSFAGNDNYNPASSKTTFDVYASSTIFEIESNASEISYGQTATITHKLSEGTTGTIRYYLNDGTLLGELSVNENFTLPVLDVGTYVIIANYSGDNDYDFAADSVSFKVNPAVNNVAVNVADVTYGNETDIVVNADVDGIYNVDVNGTEYDVTVSNGVGNKSIRLDAGHYYANVTFTNKNYDTKVKNTVFEVKKAVNNVIVNVVDVTYGNETLIVVNADVDGSYRVDVNGTIFDVAVSKGVGNKSLSLNAGKYYANATFNDENYDTVVENAVFSVNKADVDVTVEAFDVVYPQVVKVTVHSSHDGEYNLSIGDYSTVVVVINGSFEFDAGILSAGPYEIAVNFTGNDNYNSASAAKSITVKPALNNVAVNVDDVTYGEDTIILVTADVDGNYQVDVNGTIYRVAVNNGSGNKSISLNAGKYCANATFSNKNYSTNVHEALFAVNKADVELKVTSSDTIYPGKVNGIVYASRDGVYNLTVGDYSTTVFVNNGSGVFDAGVFDAGSYLIVANFSGDNNVNPADSSVLITVNQAMDVITVNATGVTYGEETLIIVAADMDGIYQVDINGSAYNVTVEDGIGNLTVSLDLGEYLVNVSYAGDLNHKANSTEYILNIRIDVSDLIVIEGSSVAYGENATVSVVLPEDASGNVTVTINDKNYTAEVEGEVTVVVIPDLAVGLYELCYVTYSGDRYYNSTSGMTSIEVKPASSDVLIVPIDDTVYPGNISIEFYVRNATTVVISVLSDDLTQVANKTIVVDDAEFESVFTVGLPAGYYMVVVSNLDNGNYTYSEDYSNFVVYQAKPVMKTSITENITAGDEGVAIHVVLPEDATGRLMVEIDGKSINPMGYVLINGTADINIPSEFITIGEHSYLVCYDGDGNYTTTFAYDTFNASGRIAECIVDCFTAVLVGGDINVTVKIENATGTVKIYLDDNLIDIGDLDENSTVRFVVEDIASDNHYLTVIYNGDNKFYPGFVNVAIDVIREDPDISVDCPVMAVVGDDVDVIVRVENAKGFVRLYFDDTFVDVEDLDENGTAAFVVEDIVSGNHYFTVTYSGDEKFCEDFMNFGIYVAKEYPSFSVNRPASAVVGEDVNVTIRIKDATGFVRLYLDEDYIGMSDLDENGTAAFVVENITSGNHYFTLVYGGDDKFYDGFLNFGISVDKKTTEANVTIPTDFKVGEEANVTVDIPGATGNVSIIIDANENNVTLDENGTSVVPMIMTPGEHSIVVVYSGDDTHSPVVKIASVNAEVLGSEFRNLTLNGDFVLSGVLVNSMGDVIANATVTYTICGVNATLTTGADGSFVVQAENNAVVLIAYDGTSDVVGTSIEIAIENVESSGLGSEFNVTEGISIKSFAVDTPAGEVGQTTSFRLTDSNGNPIVNATVKFAYKTVILNRTTDEEGIVFIGINTQVAQEALCAMSYLGDEKYNATFVAFSFDIQKKPITIFASSKTYKVSAKTKKYTVSIKTEKCNSNDGKVYLSAGKKITMKINGKTLTAKTNSKGQATFNIKITKKGKYSATVKFAGDKTYDSASKKVKITIK